MGRVQALCSLLQSLLVGPHSNLDISMGTEKLHPLICTCFVFCYVWCLGGNLVEKSMDKFDTFCRDLFGENQDVKVRMLKTSRRYACISCLNFPPIKILHSLAAYFAAN